MASPVCRRPTQEHLSLTTQKPQRTFPDSPVDWESGSFSLPSPESVDSFLSSPVSPTVPYPSDPYGLTLPKQEDCKDQIFNYGTFEDWMGWDDQVDNPLSPTSDFFPELKLEPLPPKLASSPNNNIEDGPFFCDEALGDGPLFPQTPKEEIEEQVGLYSTPLAWTQPSISTRCERPQFNFGNVVTRTPEEIEALCRIAMPPSAQRAFNSKAFSSPEPGNKQHKRKSYSDSDEEEEEDLVAPLAAPPPPTARKGKKTAHNMIEKRYRTNLNDKITALRDSVPALRVMSKKKSSAGKGEEDSEEEDLQGLTPAHRLNKATVLSKATEYITHLEKRNRALTRESNSLKSRIEAFEILLMARQCPLPLPSSSTTAAGDAPRESQVRNFSSSGGGSGGWSA